MNRKKTFTAPIIVFLVILFLFSLSGGFAYWTLKRIISFKNSVTKVEGTQSKVNHSSDSIGNLEMPAKDADGSDIDSAPRYPESIRTNYYVSQDKRFMAVDYIVRANANSILNYYRNGLAGSWQLANSSSQNLTYSRENETLKIFMIRQDQTVPITLYTLNYSIDPEVLP